MVNVKKFIFDKLNADTILDWLVGDRIYTKIVPIEAESPLIVFNRIAPWKIDLKGIRNEYFQITCWWQNTNENESIMFQIVTIFNGLKEPPIKFSDVQRLDETFDKDSLNFGNHVTIHIKIFDYNL